jgi:diacylglycerol kinase family enzyme
VSAPPSEAADFDLDSLESIGASDRRRALVIINPYATAVSDRVRTIVLAALASRYEVEAVATRARGHATEIADEAADAGYDVVVAFGGDGTVNEVANGLVGSPTPLTALPGGSANVYCKLLGIPADIVDATEHLLGLADRWRPRVVDLGMVDGRHYTFSAGIGMDAEVVRRVDARPKLKRRFGANFFLASALWTFGRRYLLRPPQMLVTVDGTTFSGVTTIVQNAQHYTYFNDHAIDLAEGATLDSGTLAGVVLRRGSLLDVPSLLLAAASSAARVGAHAQVSPFRSGGEVTVSSADARTLPLQIDGDYIGEVSEAHFTVRSGALRVLA